MQTPVIDDVLTVVHRGQTVTGRVISLAINGRNISVTLALTTPEYVLGPSGRRYDKILFQEVVS